MYLKDRHQFGSARKYTDEGFLFVPAKIARTGIQEYLAIEMGLGDRNPMDIIKVYRPPEEVFADEALSSFMHKPVTDNHPEQLLTTTTTKAHSVGFVGGEVLRDGIFVSTTLHVTDADAIKKIEEGKVELSNGYMSDIDFTQGVTPDGEQYDAVQRNIRGNHVAIVSKGRCGVSCSVSDDSPHYEKEPHMATVNIDSVDFEMPDQAAQAVRKLVDKVASLQQNQTAFDDQMAESIATNDTMKNEHQSALDVIQAKLDDAVAKVPTPEVMDSLAEQRMVTTSAAVKLVDGYEWKGKDCNIIKREVVAAMDVDVEGKSDEYVAARFDAFAETSKDGTSTTNTLDAAFTQELEDKAKNEGKSGDPVVDSRAEMIKRNQEAWKGGAK